MNRRAFLGMLGFGIVGSILSFRVPQAFQRFVGQPPWALDHLDEVWKAATRAHGHPPIALICGRKLFEAAEGELVCSARFTQPYFQISEPNFMFRGTFVIQWNDGYHCRATYEYAVNTTDHYPFISRRSFDLKPTTVRRLGVVTNIS